MHIEDQLDWQRRAHESADESVTDSVTELNVPEIRFVEKTRIGMRFCQLAAATRRRVERVSTVRISSKRNVEAYHLVGGETILVADRKIVTVPVGVTGVLLREPGRGERWQWHSALAEFTSRFEADPVGTASAIEASWRDSFRFKTEVADVDGNVAKGDEGLRPPQVGALHAIGAHWSVFANEPATVVMPTGTGKTETMLCAVVNYRRGPTLVAVPSNALRWQTARKFENLGLLRFLGVVDEDLHNPIVSVVTGEPSTPEDLELIRGCNVVVGVMSSLGGAATEALFPDIAAAVGSLFVDEAHHVPSNTWSAFRDHFKEHPIVQFTATPFRLDGKLVDDPEASSRTRIAFRLVSAGGELNEPFFLELDSTKGYRFAGPDYIRIRQGRLDLALTDYLYDYPLVVRYVSLKELEGDLLYEQTSTAPARIEDRQLQPWTWDGVDIDVESTWKEGIERPRSVQSRVAAHYIDEGFDIVFNDDDAGEAADLVCLRETDDAVRLLLVHCKYSGSAKPGERVKDVVEVSSQAIRSASWRGNFDRLHRHLLIRSRLTGNGSATRSRFVAGTVQRLAEIAKAARMKPIELEIVIVQPGVKRAKLTDDQAVVLGAASAYLQQTVDVELVVICSA